MGLKAASNLRFSVDTMLQDRRKRMSIILPKLPVGFRDTLRNRRNITRPFLRAKEFFVMFRDDFTAKNRLVFSVFFAMAIALIFITLAVSAVRRNSYAW